MKLQLKEDPREWQKSAFVLVVLLTVLSLVMVQKHRLSLSGLAYLLIVIGAAAVVAGIWPRCFRLPYRALTVFGFYVGQFMSRVILTIFFFVLIAPLGLFLRSLGKDLMRLRRSAGASSHWLPAKSPGSLDRMF
jgi:hypothetical protein